MSEEWKVDEALAKEQPEELDGLSVEQSFARLDAMAERLESEEVTLEESFRIYQEGMQLLKSVNDKLDHFEKRMQILSEDGVVEEF